ncbi:MAG TPA: cytidylate kinase-like family protein [Verrucomicrobiae bacterium]|jgi:cytidylate kinase|nr:cytidylate kinase-like family protein [Verrucomicrobiae bacterium]
MQFRIITVEREYGSGGAQIARQLAKRLGWKIWDEELTAEIALKANVETTVAQRCDERVDTLLYRLFKVYARGSYERALPLGREGPFDTDQMFATLHAVVDDVVSRGNCVVVGRGSTYFLRSRPDVFHVFIYAPAQEKIRRLEAIGKNKKEALQLIEEIDRDRASFIRHYFGVEWPNRALYNVMINSKFGDEHVVETILESITVLEKLRAPRSASA